jgi:hypothetical protein
VHVGLSHNADDLLINPEDASYKPPILPERRDRAYLLDDLDLMRPGTKSEILHNIEQEVPESAAKGIAHPRRRVLNALARGIQASEYARLPEIDVLDRAHAVSAVVSGAGAVLPGQGVTVDDNQPYAVFGWVEARPVGSA